MKNKTPATASPIPKEKTTGSEGTFWGARTGREREGQKGRGWRESG